MIQKDNNGFDILKNGDWGDFLVIKEIGLNRYVDYYTKGKFNKITINSFLGYQSKNIDFIYEIKDSILGLLIANEGTNINPVNSLRELRYLGLPSKIDGIIDFNNLTKLSKLAMTYSQGTQNFENCKSLQTLILSSYNTKLQNLSKISKLLNLRELHLFGGNVNSLNGVELLPSLNKLILYKQKTLNNIKNLAKCHSIAEVHIDSCKSIDDLDALGELPHLEKLIIVNCGKINSVSFIKKLPLKFISVINTTIEDCDTSHFIGIDYVAFDSKQNYSHSLEDVRAKSKR